MRTKLFFVCAAVRWVLLMFLIAPAVEAPLVALPSEPIKPLRVWTTLASWYGPHFDGQATASGEMYNDQAPTAAHPNLPFGSVLRLINPKNGRSHLVRINDRGPFVEGRGLDVSYVVACRLGMEDRGLTRLRVELLEVPPRR